MKKKANFEKETEEEELSKIKDLYEPNLDVIFVMLANLFKQIRLRDAKLKKSTFGENLRLFNEQKSLSNKQYKDAMNDLKKNILPTLIIIDALYDDLLELLIDNIEEKKLKMVYNRLHSDNFKLKFSF